MSFFCKKQTTVKPLKTATLRGMRNWPSYRGGRLMEHHHLSTIVDSEHVLGVSNLSKWTQLLRINKKVFLATFWVSKNWYRHFGTIFYLGLLVKTALMPWLAVMRGKFTLHFSFGEWKSGRLIEVGRLKVAVLWNFFIKDSLGVGQGNELLAVLQRWPS